MNKNATFLTFYLPDIQAFSNSETLVIEPKYDKVGFLKNGNIYGQKGLYQFTLNTKGKILDKEFKPEIIKNVFFGLIISLMIGLTVFVFKTK